MTYLIVILAHALGYHLSKEKPTPKRWTLGHPEPTSLQSKHRVYWIPID